MKNLVTEWKNGIYTNNIITFNETLENLSTATVELTNIYESSHEEIILIFNMESFIKINRLVLLRMVKGKHCVNVNGKQYI